MSGLLASSTVGSDPARSLLVVQRLHPGSATTNLPKRYRLWDPRVGYVAQHGRLTGPDRVVDFLGMVIT